MDENMDPRERADAIDASVAHLSLADLSMAATRLRERVDYMKDQIAEAMRQAEGWRGVDEGQRLLWQGEVAAMLAATRIYAAGADALREVIARRTAH
jgi:hypothetical protein